MMHRALPRSSALASALSFRQVRLLPSNPARLALPFQIRRQHAIANPLLAGIEKRWEAMPPQEQAELWMKLRDRMKSNWHDMTMQEKKAAYWIAFGPHGPRAGTPPGQNWYIFNASVACCVLGVVIMLVIRMFARDAPRTMTKEWQEATNEYLKSQNTEPISGVSSEGYTGKGMVQSKPAKKGGGVGPSE